MPAQGSSNKSKFLSVKTDAIMSPPRTKQSVQDEHQSLRLDELQKIFDLFYGNQNEGFRDVQIMEDGADTCIPHL